MGKPVRGIAHYKTISRWNLNYCDQTESYFGGTRSCRQAYSEKGEQLVPAIEKTIHVQGRTEFWNKLDRPLVPNGVSVNTYENRKRIIKENLAPRLQPMSIKIRITQFDVGVILLEYTGSWWSNKKQQQQA